MARIFLSLVDPASPADYTYGDGAESWTVPISPSARDCYQTSCPRCGRSHDTLYTIRRVLADTLGHFPVYRLNGERAIIDGSLPHIVARLPRDAAPVSPDDAAGFWHDDNESHTFGGPNIAAALRATIAEANGH